MNKERNYGIDLLRIVLMFMVCILHVIWRGGILTSFKTESVEDKVYFLWYTICLYAVNGFAIISGYMATNKKQRYSKIIEMWFQVFFYSFILTIILTIIGICDGGGSGAELIKCALPVSAKRYWYFTAYFGLFFLTPILNKYIFLLNERIAKICFVFTILLFCVIGLPGDAFETNNGYSMLWITVLYVIGALAKIGKIFEKKTNITLIVILILNIILTWWSNVVLGRQILVSYISPTMLMCGLLIVIIFSRLKIKVRFISKISSLAFGVYLFQLNPVVWKWIEGKFAFINNKNVFWGSIYILLISVMLFLLGIFIELIRKQLAKKMKISVLSSKIVDIANILLEKVIIILQ